MDRIMTVPEVAKYLRMSPSKLYLLLQQKKIPHVRIGRNVRIRETELKEWIEAQAVKDQPRWTRGDGRISI
jgi:excisionase family DNA binding protein